MKKADGIVLSENPKQMEKMEGKAGCEKDQRTLPSKWRKLGIQRREKSEEL